MATKTPPAAPPAPAPAPVGNRFFDWMRAINLPRQHGWIGGVCAGVAARLGIDPIIVRGIAVVIAVLGGPAFLLYAAAWLLLPDADDRIHLERLIKGDVDRADIGIGALVVLSLLPFAQGFWFLGSSYWNEPYWTGSIGRATWTVVLLAAAVVAIVWVARRASRSSAEPTLTPATTDARPETVPEAPSASDASGASGSTVPDPAAVSLDSASVDSALVGARGAGAAPVPPPAPASGAPPEDVAAWREQQSRWKSEHAAWKVQQAASARELRDQRAADERRRLRRLANPRITGSQVVITLGAALLVGGVAALVSQSGDSWTGYGVVVGLAAATITVALSAIVAGIIRRRSGFLGFIALLLATSTVLVSFVPPDRTLVGFSASTGIELGGRYAQTVGSFTAFGSDESAQTRRSTLDLWQGAGNVYVSIPRGATVRVEANLREANLSQYRYKKVNDEWLMVLVKTPHTKTADGRYSYSFTVGSGTPTKTVRIWQGSGDIQVEREQPFEALNQSEPSASPTTPATDPASPETGVKP